MFVCFEGIDGVGKSTQAALLLQRLQNEGINAELVADPGTTAIGKAVRHILLENSEGISSEAQFLLFAAARAELAHYIRQRLDKGVVVICDRWLLSSLVYQGTLNGIDTKLIESVFEATTGGLRPDICFVLHAPLEVAVARMKGPTDRYEAIDMQQRELLANAYLFHGVFSNHAIKSELVDADRAAQETAEAVYAILAERLAPAT